MAATIFAGAWSEETLRDLREAICRGYNDKVVFLAGSRGGGKSTLVSEVVRKCRNTVHIDLVGSDGESHPAHEDDYVKLVIDAVG